MLNSKAPEAKMNEEPATSCVAQFCLALAIVTLVVIGIASNSWGVLVLCFLLVLCLLSAASYQLYSEQLQSFSRNYRLNHSKNETLVKLASMTNQEVVDSMQSFIVAHRVSFPKALQSWGINASDYAYFTTRSEV